MTDYRENCLTCEEYNSLRRSVGWKQLCEAQASEAISRSVLVVTAVRCGRTVAMGRLVGDGVYYLITDVAVVPELQGQGIGGRIVDILLSYAESRTPAGGSASVQLIAERGREEFYLKKGFASVPNSISGAGMQRIIRK